MSLRNRIDRIERRQPTAGDARPWELFTQLAHGVDLWQHDRTGEVCDRAELQRRAIRCVLVERPAGTGAA